MSKKQWFTVEVECVKYSASSTCKVGEKWTVAKVKSYGLAFIVAEHLQETTYKPEYFKVSIK